MRELHCALGGSVMLLLRPRAVLLEVLGIIVLAAAPETIAARVRGHRQ